jgi:hypothetical protein
VALLLAGCLSGDYSVAPPSVEESRAERPHVGKAAANFPEADQVGPGAPGGATEERPKGSNGPPAPRTLPQAVRTYLRSLHESLPEPKPDGDGTSPKNGPRKEDPNGEDKQGKEKGPGADAAAQKQQGEGKVGKAGGKEKKDEEGKGDKDNGKEKDGAGNGKDKADRGASDKDKEAPKETWFSAHTQATMVTQSHDFVRALYTGPNSLVPVPESRTSATATLFLAARLWEYGHNSGELVLNPEMAGGIGFSHVYALTARG